jgi:endonuclease YncB( thermonuclease family)
MLRLALLLFLLPAVAFAEVTGKPEIVDAGTLEIAGQRIRLAGIEAPAFDQTCRADGRPWRCGFEAASALAYFIAGSWVTCQERGQRDDGALAATCYAGGVGGPDVAVWLVVRGWALAAPGSRYLTLQEGAREARQGLWRGTFVPPAEYRRGRRLAGGQESEKPLEGEVCVAGRRVPGGVECPAFRGDDGKLYTLLGDLGGLREGAPACLCGKVARMSICMQGTTLAVTQVAPMAACAVGSSRR